MTTTQTTTDGWRDWGLDAPAPAEPEGPDDEPEREVSDPQAWLPWLTFAAAVIVVLLLAAALASSLGPAKVATFTDPLGRDCTQLSKGHALALSCAPKPIEQRLADGLRSASQRANS